MEIESARVSVSPPKRGRWLFRIGGSVFFLLCLWRLNIDPQQIVQHVRQADEIRVGVAFGLIVPIVLLKAWRWQILLHERTIFLPYRSAVYLYAQGIAAGTLTPGQAGDMLKCWWLRQRGYPWHAATIAVILDRVYDVLLLGLVAGISTFCLGVVIHPDAHVVMVLGGCVLVGLLTLGIGWRSSRVRYRLSPFLHRLRRRIDGLPLGNRMTPSSSDPTPGKVLRIIAVSILTVVTTALAISRVWLLAQAVGLTLPLEYVVAVSSLATVASLIPISVNGIGTRDVALVTILGVLGYGHDSAISLSLLVLSMNMANLLLGIGYLFHRSV